MKILYIVHMFFPRHIAGTEKFTLKLSTQMKNMGHEVRVLTNSFEEDEAYDKRYKDILYKDYAYNGIPVRAIKHKRDAFVFELYGDAKSVEAAEHFLKEESPDLIHITHPLGMGEFIKAAIDLKIPYIITLTDFFLMCPKITLVNSKGCICSGPNRGERCKQLCPEMNFIPWTRRFSKSEELLSRASSLVSPSAFLSKIFNKKYKNINVKVINHGIDYTTIEKNNKVYKANDRLCFGYVGSIAHHKGVHIALDAVKALKNYDFSLKLYGAGSYDLVENKLREISDTNKVQVLGRFAELKDVYSNIDVAMVPSIWYENYPMTLHEAIASNVPVIASDIGGMAEKVKDGVNGFTFKVGNAEHLAQVMKMLIEKPEILNDLKNNIANYNLPSLTEEASNYEREYRRVIKTQ